jgi:hypothetical protein
MCSSRVRIVGKKSIAVYCTEYTRYESFLFVSTFFSNRALASAVLALTFHKHAHSRTRGVAEGSAGGAGEGGGRGGRGQWGQESAQVCAALTQRVTDHNTFYFLGTTERLSKNRKRTGAKLCDSRVEREEEMEEQGGGALFF